MSKVSSTDRPEATLHKMMKMGPARFSDATDRLSPDQLNEVAKADLQEVKKELAVNPSDTFHLADAATQDGVSQRAKARVFGAIAKTAEETVRNGDSGSNDILMRSVTGGMDKLLASDTRGIVSELMQGDPSPRGGEAMDNKALTRHLTEDLRGAEFSKMVDFDNDPQSGIPSQIGKNITALLGNRFGKDSDFYSTEMDPNGETIHPNAANLGFYMGSLDQAFEKINKDTEKEAALRANTLKSIYNAATSVVGGAVGMIPGAGSPIAGGLGAGASFGNEAIDNWYNTWKDKVTEDRQQLRDAIFALANPEGPDKWRPITATEHDFNSGYLRARWTS